MNKRRLNVKTTVKLYTRNRCHLCENAKAMIFSLKEKWDFYYNEADIDESDELTEKYGLMIPVVEINGEEVQYGQIDKGLLEEELIRQNTNLLS